MPDKTYDIRCPFHGEQREPTMVVNTTQGIYHCFDCGTNGDVLTALRAIGKLEQGERYETQAADSIELELARRER